MDPTRLLQHLHEVCQDLDEGRPMRRPAFAVAVAVSLSVGCGTKDTSDTGAVAEYAAPMEDCVNGADDDGDDLVDCNDSDCTDDPACTLSDYAAPFE